MVDLKHALKCLFALHIASNAVCAATTDYILLVIEEHIGLVMLVASVVIIILQILTIFFLQSINEHLNWIRRIR